MDNNGKNFSVIKIGVHNNYCHYEERSDEVIHSHTRIFGIATKIFDFLAIDKFMCHAKFISASCKYTLLLISMKKFIQNLTF